MEAVGAEAVGVLDHGYITLIEVWGSDEAVIAAARQSTGKGFRTWEPYLECRACGHWTPNDRGAEPCPDTRSGGHDWRAVPRGDLGLLAYLHAKRHTTPFEAPGLTVQVQAPIFVFREWQRHRTQSYNEMSARYIPLPDVNYVPTVERLMANSKTNKQAGVVRGAEELTEETAEKYRRDLQGEYEAQEVLYQSALKIGVPKELARVHLPVGRYSRMMASANLLNWLKFLALRTTAKNPDAQYEIRVYADALAQIMRNLFPRTMELFSEG